MKIVLAAAAVAAVLAAPSALAGGATLTGTVGPGYTIALTQNGKKVTSVKAGTYTFKIGDKSSFHDFHLKGPGVDKKTSVSGTGSQSWTVTLKAGTYTFQCDPHRSIMHGSFKVS
jgi:plastocyanin